MAKKNSHVDDAAAKLRTFRDLLLWEATGGIIPLPKGAEGYKVPPIPFSERRSMLDSMNRDLLTNFKVDPKDEVSAFELLKSGGHDKRKSRKDSGGGVQSPPPDRGPGDPAALDPLARITGEPVDISTESDDPETSE